MLQNNKIVLFLCFVVLMACAGSAGAAAEPLVSSGISMITISAADLQTSKNFFVDELGLIEVASGSYDAYTTRQIWPFVPANTESEVVLLQKGTRESYIHLVEFYPNTGEASRGQDNNTWDIGLFGLGIRVRDYDETQERMEALGYSYVNPPFNYTAEWTGNTVREGILIGPDSFPMALIQRVDPPDDPPFPHAFGDIIDFTQVLWSIDEAVEFYQNFLGLMYVGDTVMAPGEVDQFLGLPDDTVTRIAFFVHPEQRNYAPLEVLQYQHEGRGLADTELLVTKTRTNNVGKISLSYLVDDLEYLLQQASKRHIPVLKQISEHNLVGFGTVRTAILEAPSGICVQFIQPLP